MPFEISLTGWRLLRALVDAVCGVLALIAAFWFRILVPLPFTLGLMPTDRLGFFSLAVPLVLLLQNPLLYFLGFYELPHPRSNDDRLRRLVTASLFQGLLIVAFFFLASERFPRTIVLFLLFFNVAFLLVSRLLLDRIVITPRRSAAIIGAGRKAMDLAKNIAKYPWYGVEVVGHVPVPGDTGEGPGPLLGSLADIPDLIDRGVFQQVVIAHEQHSWQTELVAALATKKHSASSILLLPNVFESLLGRTKFRSVHDIPLIELSPARDWSGHELMKRLFDLLVSTVLLLLASPVLVGSSVLIKATSKGSVFYRQERVGRHREPFVVWKLRTMRSGAESGREVLSSRDDPRKTRVGTFLRATRIDEIPQLLNVLRGEMSLVGPRPERPGFVDQYLKEIPGYGARFAARPGVTGLAQINGEYESAADNKLRYDLAYISNGSIWLDLTILVRTVRTVLTSRGV